MTRTAPLSPECQLVFRCADAETEPSEFATLARAVRDWPRVRWLAEREVATAALWRVLRPHAALLPGAVAEHLRKSAMVSDFRMQQLSLGMQRATTTLAARGVPHLLLKGAAIGALTDATFRSRPMTDVDLLVHREDQDRARAAVIDSGWPETTDPVLLELLQDAHHLPHFVDPQMPGVRLELHLSLLPRDQPFAFDESLLWRDARAAPEPFTGALLPSREHLVLHTCVHFAWQHTMHFGAWRTFRAVSAITRAPGFDWDGLVRTAHDARAATSCYWTLRLASRLSGIVVPDRVLAHLAPPTAEWVREALERHFVAAIAMGEGPVSPSIQVTRLLWRTALRPKWSGHRDPGRSDPEKRWERARGTLSTETFAERVVRHLEGYSTWWRFLTRTLLRRP